MSLIIRFFCSYLLLVSISSCSRPQQAQKAEKPIFVKFEQASLKPVSLSFETAGEIKADEEILVSAERQGQVEKIYVKEGDYVNKGQLLVQIKGKDIAADLNKAQADYDSYQALYKEGAISELDFLQYQANLEKIKSQMANLNITAITSGVVGEIHVDLGDYVNLGNPILDLVKLYPLRISYSIPERLLSKIKLGQSLEFTADSYPGESFTAKVDFIAPKADPLSRTILVRASIDQTDKKLKANQFVTVKQIVREVSNALMVREEAVYLDQGAEYLYLAADSETESAEHEARGSRLEDSSLEPGAQSSEPQYIAKRVKIQTGLREPGWVEILEGIEEGDNVVYAGLTTIYPGANLVKVEDVSQD